MSEPTVRFVRVPVDGPITGGFGVWYGSYQHRGVDFGVPTGTTVYAPAAGRVVAPFNDGSFGVAICLDHGDGWYTLYAHLSRSNVATGDTVRAEQIIGYSGNTGMSTGPHLHWQLSDSPSFPIALSHSRDPMLYLEEGMTDNDILAIFGSTEVDPAERLTNAHYRYDESIRTGNSPFSVAANAEANLATHKANHPGGAIVGEHSHEPGKVAR